MFYTRMAACLLAAASPFIAAAETTPAELQRQIDALKTDYEQRLQQLEQSPAAPASANSFNPQLSVILDGRINAYQQAADHYELPGFALGGEAGLAKEGLSLGHSEITASANADDKFMGKLTLALHDEAGETHLEMEEAFLETLALGSGFTLRGGRFFAGVGYLNQQHDHAWDFADAPLIYAGLWGNKYIDDGVRVSWLAPTDTFLEFGAEIFAGGAFPAGGNPPSNIGANVYFINLGGDIGISNSWQSGLSYYTANPENRENAAHDHGNAVSQTPGFSGESDVIGASFIYKWAPNGNYKNTHIKIQAEYFTRDEKGDIQLINSTPLATSQIEGTQQGYYVQARWQFAPQWASAVRYDALKSHNTGTDMPVIEQAGLANEGINPERYSAAIEWLPSEFSRLRLQYNHDQSYEKTDNQIMLQYTLSLGAHSAHGF